MNKCINTLCDQAATHQILWFIDKDKTPVYVGSCPACSGEVMRASPMWNKGNPQTHDEVVFVKRISNDTT